MVVGSAGQLYDLGFNNVLTPVVVANNIFPGQGVSKVIGADYQVRLPQTDIATATVSTALITGNSTVATLNGIALAPVVFATNNATTLTAIAALIAAQPGIASAVSDGTSVITVTASQGSGVTLSLVTTAGATQPTWAVVLSGDNVFYGVAIRIQNKMNLYSAAGSAGPSPYIPGDPIPVLTRGRVWVTVENTVTSDSPVYWRVTATVGNPTLGLFRSDSDGGNAVLLPSTNVRWIVGATAGNLAVLDINLA
jgi:hypothetical protein